MTGDAGAGAAVPGSPASGSPVPQGRPPGAGGARRHEGVATTTWVTFELSGDLYGVDVRRVQEVLADQRVAPVPLAPAAVAGLVNLRGQVVTAVDLRRRLGLPGARPGASAPHVVVRAGEEAVSLVVEGLGDVLEVADDDVQPPPDTIAGHLATVVTGACPLPDRLLLLLDVDALVGTAPPEGACPPRHDRPRRPVP